MRVKQDLPCSSLALLLQIIYCSDAFSSNECKHKVWFSLSYHTNVASKKILFQLLLSRFDKTFMSLFRRCFLENPSCIVFKFLYSLVLLLLHDVCQITFASNFQQLGNFQSCLVIKYSLKLYPSVDLLLVSWHNSLLLLAKAQLHFI